MGSLRGYGGSTLLGAGEGTLRPFNTKPNLTEGEAGKRYALPPKCWHRISPHSMPVGFASNQSWAFLIIFPRADCWAFGLPVIVCRHLSPHNQILCYNNMMEWRKLLIGRNTYRGKRIRKSECYFGARFALTNRYRPVRALMRDRRLLILKGSFVFMWTIHHHHQEVANVQFLLPNPPPSKSKCNFGGSASFA